MSNSLDPGKDRHGVSNSLDPDQDQHGVSNSLDPGEDRHYVGPYLGQNCLQRLSVADKRKEMIDFKLFFLQMKNCISICRLRLIFPINIWDSRRQNLFGVF